MCQESRTPDGGRQEDGFGIAYWDGQKWRVFKSLQPIWQRSEIFKKIPPTKFLVAHARSAGLVEQKGNLDYNQPYVNKDLCFVFNGLIRGVSFKTSIDGNIGAQKIFSLLQKNQSQPSAALKNTFHLLSNHSRKVEAFNVGLISQEKISLVCHYENHPEYFKLHYLKSTGRTTVCSARLNSQKWRALQRGEIIEL